MLAMSLSIGSVSLLAFVTFPAAPFPRIPSSTTLVSRTAIFASAGNRGTQTQSFLSAACGSRSIRCSVTHWLRQYSPGGLLETTKVTWKAVQRSSLSGAWRRKSTTSASCGAASTTLICPHLHFLGILQASGWTAARASGTSPRLWESVPPSRRQWVTCMSPDRNSLFDLRPGSSRSANQAGKLGSTGISPVKWPCDCTAPRCLTQISRV